jgi:hypothetical protein
VEFSFKYGDNDEKYPGTVTQRAYKVFQILQGPTLAGWIDHKSKTKTAYVYDVR